VIFKAQIHNGVIRPDPAHVGNLLVFAAKFQPGQEFDLTIEKATKRRTLPQNKRMWRILQVFEALGWEKDEAKKWCCDEFLPPVVHEFPDGTRTESTRGTRFLNTAQMGESMDRIERFLNEKGLWYPETA